MVGFFSYYWQVQSLETEEYRIFYFQWKCLDILKTNQVNISCKVCWVFKKITI